MAHSTTNCVTGNMLLTPIQRSNAKAMWNAPYKVVANLVSQNSSAAHQGNFAFDN